jgi:hypothetical protein
MLALLDQTTGATRASTRSCGDADDVFFDAKRHRFYVSCGTGEVATFAWDGQELRALPPVGTSSGARTSLFVPEMDLLFVARRAGMLRGKAAILVYRPTP